MKINEIIEDVEGLYRGLIRREAVDKMVQFHPEQRKSMEEAIKILKDYDRLKQQLKETRESAWQVQETNGRLKEEIRNLKAYAKMGNIPYKEAIALKEENAKLKEKYETTREVNLGYINEIAELKKGIMKDEYNVIVPMSFYSEIEKNYELQAKLKEYVGRVENLQEALCDEIEKNNGLQGRVAELSEYNDKPMGGFNLE